MRIFHNTRFCASSFRSLSFRISSATHSFHDFLLLPFPLTPSRTNSLQADTQSSALFRSTCPNHLSLDRLTMSETLSIPNFTRRSSLDTLFFKVTPHFHLIIILSVLSNLCILPLLAK